MIPSLNCGFSELNGSDGGCFSSSLNDIRQRTFSKISKIVCFETTFAQLLQFFKVNFCFVWWRDPSVTAQKMKFSTTDFFSKWDQIRRFLRISSHLLKKSVMENFIFCAVGVVIIPMLIPRGFKSRWTVLTERK